MITDNIQKRKITIITKNRIIIIMIVKGPLQYGERFLIQQRHYPVERLLIFVELGRDRLSPPSSLT